MLRMLLKPRLTDTALRLLGERGATTEPMLRNTVNATIVRGGVKINVVPSEIELELDGRALPGVGPDELIARCRRSSAGTSSSSSSATTQARRSPISASSTRSRT